MTSDQSLSVVLFSGGRGTSSIADALLKYPEINLKILVNAYDDGLSTGLLRRFIPGMLGPSDFRKVISRLLKHRTDDASQALHTLFEYRFPDPMKSASALKQFEQFIDPAPITTTHKLLTLRERLSLSQWRVAARFISAFLNYYNDAIKSCPWFGFGDTSFGNFLFAGAYLANKRDFNAGLQALCQLANLPENQVLNVTRGENRVLVAIKANGQYLRDEAAIVGPQDNQRIDEIFLLPNYLPESKLPSTTNRTAAIEFVRQQESLPTINPIADQALRTADVIIYGPGTQFSSLYPSYLTIGLAEAVIDNKDAEKIFIANIARDHDIANESATTLVDAFLWNMSRKGTAIIRGRDLITRFFFQKPEPASEATNYLPFDMQAFEYPIERVLWVDWEGDSGKHAGGRIVSELLLLIEGQLKKNVHHLPHKVSIIVPALNEAPRIGQVLHDLRQLDLSSLHLEKEIIVVDGGSDDETVAIARSTPDIRFYQLPSHVRGRGRALQLGLEKARGELIIFFPSDGEYTVSDIPRLISPLLADEFPVVFGSRAFRSTDLGGTLKRIYGAGPLATVSKYGGILISTMILTFHQRYVGDPLTTMKGFHARALRPLKFHRAGVDFDMELIRNLARTGHSILEVPVSYTARTVDEGKKMTVRDGVQCLIALLPFA